MAIKRYNGTAWITQAGRAASIIDSTPPGAITIFAGSTAPSGYLLCDGTAISRTTYSALFAITSTTYGVGNGSTTFNLPDLRTRVPVGKNASGTFATLGATGGAETHILNEAQMPSHIHSVNPPSANFTSGGVSADHSHSDDHQHSGATASMNRNASHSHSASLYEWNSLPTSGGSRLAYTRNSNAVNGVQAALPGIAATDTNHEHGFTTNFKSQQGYGSTTGGVSSDHNHTTTVDIPAFNSASAGSNIAHNNLQPYTVLNYIIKT